MCAQIQLDDGLGQGSSSGVCRTQRSPEDKAMDSAWADGEGFTRKATGELGLEG